MLLLWGTVVDADAKVEIQAVSRAAVESMGPEWLKIFEGTIMACTISSLQPGCTYRLRVRCANQAGFGSWCMPIDLLTAPDVPGAPGAPVIQQSGTVGGTMLAHHAIRSTFVLASCVVSELCSSQWRDQCYV